MIGSKYVTIVYTFYSEGALDFTTVLRDSDKKNKIHKQCLRYQH